MRWPSVKPASPSTARNARSHQGAHDLPVPRIERTAADAALLRIIQPLNREHNTRHSKLSSSGVDRLLFEKPPPFQRDSMGLVTLPTAFHARPRAPLKSGQTGPPQATKMPVSPPRCILAYKALRYKFAGCVRLPQQKLQTLRAPSRPAFCRRKPVPHKRVRPQSVTP